MADDETTSPNGRVTNERLLEVSIKHHNVILSILDDHKKRLDGHDVAIRWLGFVVAFLASVGISYAVSKR